MRRLAILLAWLTVPSWAAEPPTPTDQVWAAVGDMQASSESLEKAGFACLVEGYTSGKDRTTVSPCWRVYLRRPGYDYVGTARPDRTIM